MEMPGDDHAGWDRLLAAVLGDLPPAAGAPTAEGATTADDADPPLLELVPDWAHDEAS